MLIEFLMMAGMAAQVRDLAPKVAEPGVSAEVLGQWNEMTAWVRIPTSAELNEQMALILGPWTGLAVSALWTAIAVTAGAWRLRRRDA